MERLRCSLAVGVMVDRIRLAKRTTHLEVGGVYGVLTWLWRQTPLGGSSQSSLGVAQKALTYRSG
jgi:hypothetical protein